MAEDERDITELLRLIAGGEMVMTGTGGTRIHASLLLEAARTIDFLREDIAELRAELDDADVSFRELSVNSRPLDD